MKILSIIGARPQFIKVALISRRLQKEGIEEILVHTGQHYNFNMSDIFFDELNLAKPDYHLGIGSGTHSEQTGKMLIEIEKVLFQEKPDVVLVYGDTNTTLAGALATTKLHIPVAHIEAGLRSYNKRMPEEVNRVLTDHCSDILFCPTETAVNNLQKEGFTDIINNGKLIGKSLGLSPVTDYSSPIVINVGDVMFDVALEVKNRIDEKKILTKYTLKPKDFILVTIHRAENTDIKENLESIWNALRDIANSGIKTFFPIHPRTKKALDNYGLINGEVPKNLIIMQPVSYFEMIALESNAKIIITDSGGVQKEGYFFKTSCIIPRNETEWVELVEIGWNKLVGNKEENIVEETIKTYSENVNNKKWIDFYGGGKASDRIVETIGRIKNRE
ncbi:UDP-N-acetyl glucosamine 2-epimerase [Patescibacteria group bacterium]|nr:UDP-N-acetyl glucosamine 2-epimerase [Patescibacteria group bacterium]